MMGDVIRYEIRYGKFGAYFYDQLENMDLTLEQVCNRLNLLEKIKNRGYI